MKNNNENYDNQFNGYSDIAKTGWNKLAFNNLTPEEVINYFYSDFPVRNFKDLLMKFSQNNNMESLKTQLIDRFVEYKGLDRDNIRRTISGWLSGEHEPKNRDDLIMICFALDMKENNADLFLRHTSDGGFHLRNPQEAALFYCIKKEKNYFETQEFISKVDLTYDEDEAYSEEKLTKIVSNAFMNISNDNEFLIFIDENRSNFGKLHNTAYKNFRNYYDVLAKPDDFAGESRNMSVKDIVEIYLRMGVPGPSAKYHDALQKMVRLNWAEETTIKRIIERKIDVPRKLLLLLYIVTEGIGVDSIRQQVYKNEAEPLKEKKDYDFLEYASAEEFMSEHATNISVMLKESGFSVLDPRNPFDWLILYCLKPDDNNPDPIMSEKLQDVLERLFAKE